MRCIPLRRNLTLFFNSSSAVYRSLRFLALRNSCLTFSLYLNDRYKLLSKYLGEGELTEKYEAFLLTSPHSCTSIIILGQVGYILYLLL